MGKLRQLYLRSMRQPQLGRVTDCPLEIGRRAFAGCTALTSIELPRTMHKELGDYLFEGCTSLVSATLPAVGGFGVFEGCKRLQEVTVGGVTFFASDWDEDYLSYVVMAARSDALDIRQGVIFDSPHDVSGQVLAHRHHP